MKYWGHSSSSGTCDTNSSGCGGLYWVIDVSSGTTDASCATSKVFCPESCEGPQALVLWPLSCGPRHCMGQVVAGAVAAPLWCSHPVLIAVRGQTRYSGGRNYKGQCLCWWPCMPRSRTEANNGPSLAICTQRWGDGWSWGSPQPTPSAIVHTGLVDSHSLSWSRSPSAYLCRQCSSKTLPCSARSRAHEW
jgi:hypothetical protein